MRELIRPTLKTIQWGALAAAILCATYVVWNYQHLEFGSASGLAFGLRMAAGALALGLAFVLDDPTEDTTGHTPISVLQRRALRITLTLPIVIGYWLLLLAWANAAAYLKTDLDAWPFLLEVIALSAVAFAGATIGSSLIADRLGGPAGAGAVFLVGLTTVLLPWGHGLLLRTPGSAAHDASLRWWLLIAGLSAVAWLRMSVTPGMPLVRLGVAGFRRRPAVAVPAWFTRKPKG